MSEKAPDLVKFTGICSHGNLPNNCSLCREEARAKVQAVDPRDLLLSAKEEAAIEQQAGEIKRIHLGDGSQELVVLGVEHTSELERVQSIADELAAFTPDIVFVEGETLEKRFPNMTLEEILAMPAEQVLQQQEQAYTFWLALKQRREVRSWDLPKGGEIQGALQLVGTDGKHKHSIEDAVEWHVVYAIRKLYESNVIPSAEVIFNVIKQGVPSAIEILSLTPENIAQTVQKVTGKKLDEFSQRAEDTQLRSVDQDFVTNFSDPRTNPFARDMNVVRDRHAIGVIQQAKAAGYKRILVTAGRSHAYTWEPAIRAIYDK